MSETLAGVAALLRVLPPAAGDAERLERIGVIEGLKAQLAAVQAAETAAFVASQRAARRAAGVPEARVGRGVPEQVARARRISPYQAHRYCGWAMILTGDLPETFAALARGEVSEWRALIVARETIWCSRADRAAVDAELAPRLPGLGDRGVEVAVKKIAYRLDPAAFTARARAAANERRVTVRPAPDTMCRLTALLPVAQGVAAYAALARHADTTVGTGDSDGHGRGRGRGRGQVMADTLVERLTGQASAEAVPVEIELVLTDRTLLDGGEEPASIPGAGPLPAPVARELALHPDAPRWLRRLYQAPSTGQLVAMDTHRRVFTPSQRRFVRLRDDGTCRTPWCDAPIRHTDHITPAGHGGATSLANARGLCAGCNYARQGPNPVSPLERLLVERIRAA